MLWKLYKIEFVFRRLNFPMRFHRCGHYLTSLAYSYGMVASLGVLFGVVSGLLNISLTVCCISKPILRGSDSTIILLTLVTIVHHRHSLDFKIRKFSWNKTNISSNFKSNIFHQGFPKRN